MYSLVILTVLCLVPRHGAFALDETGRVTDIFNAGIKIASRGRTVIAFLAGKLMSNDWVYASGLGLDKTLFTMWNYMKNIANFVLGFLLIAGVLKSLFSQNAYDLKKELPKFLVASILVNMSWFIMGSLLDVANVATVAVGAFPQAFINDDTMKDGQAQKLNISIPENIYVNYEDPKKGCERTYIPTKSIDSIRARFNDMSGPLLYLGTSIYRFQDYCDLNQDVTSFKNFTIGQMIKIITLVMFLVPIIALFFINLQRVFYLWLWIIFAPIVVLLEVMKIKIDAGKMKDILSFKEIIGMIFQPVFTIGGLSIVLLLSMSMYYVIGGTPGQNASNTPISKVYGSAEVISSSTYSTFHNASAGTEITFVGDVFKDVASYAGGIVGYLIITIFTVMLLWAIVKMSTSGSKIASGTFKKITDLGESLAGGLNIVPIGGGRTISLAAAMNADQAINNMGSQFTGALKQKSRDGIESTFYNSSFGKAFQKMYKSPYDKDTMNDLNYSEVAELQSTLPNMQSLKTYIEELNSKLGKAKKASNGQKYIKYNSPQFRKVIENTILNNDTVKNELATTLGVDIKDITKAKLFDKTGIVGQKFMNYLQTNIQSGYKEGRKVTTIKNIGDDFTFFGTPPAEENTTQNNTPVTPPPTTQ